MERPSCTRYTVHVNGQNVPVIQTPEAAVARLLITGAAQIKVTTNAPFSQVVVRPLREKVTPKVEAAALEFEIPRAGYYTVELDGDLDYPLLILVDVPVEVPSGEDVIAIGPGHHSARALRLRDNMILHLHHDAIIDGGVLLNGLNNIQLIGTGIIDADIDSDVSVKTPLLITECTNVVVDGPLIISKGNWNCIIRRSRKVSIQHLKAASSDVCSDGIDIDGSAEVRVADCFIKCNDDCLCIKSSPLAKGAPVDDVEFRNCILWNGPAGNGIELGYESQTEYFRDITFRDIDILHVLSQDWGGWVDRIAGISMHITHDAHVQNVLFENITLEDVRTPKAIQFMTFHYYREHGWFSPGDRLARGRITGVHLKDIHFIEAAAPRIHIEGFNAADDIEDITFENVTFGGIDAQDVPNLVFEMVNTKNFLWKRATPSFESSSTYDLEPERMLQRSPSLAL